MITGMLVAILILMIVILIFAVLVMVTGLLALELWAKEVFERSLPGGEELQPYLDKALDIIVQRLS